MRADAVKEVVADYEAAPHRYLSAALLELCRVATEVRVFPLVLQGSGEPVKFIPRLRSRLESEFGISSEAVDVDYEFQRGAHHMLRLRPSIRPR